MAAIIFAGAFPTGSFADSIPQDKTKNKKLKRFVIASTATYGAALYGLNKAWYADFPRSEFHFFNDNKEWKQLDKIGHFYSAFHISHTSVHLLRKAALEDKKAYFWGSVVGMIMLTPIEILDGFSEEYGASWGDLIANTSGAMLSYGQYVAWDEIRIKPKYSFSRSSLANNRPNVLGNGLHEEFLKDYNGQTYWLSFDLFSFQKKASFPKWLNVAIGYGADNLIFARDSENQQQGFDAYRQYYLALDFDLSHIDSRSKFVNTVLYIVDLVHLPAPSLEYNRVKGWSFHVLKF